LPFSEKEMNYPSINVLLVTNDAALVRLLRESQVNGECTPINLTHCTRLSDALQRLTHETLTHTVVLDPLLPDSQGIETFLQIQRQAPNVRIIVLIESDDEHLALKTMRAGAYDYFVKSDCSCRILARLIRYAVDGERAQEQLRVREEFFRLISENVSDLIAVVDRDGRRLYNNASYQDLLGDPEAAHGTNSFAEVHPEDRERIQRVFQETLATGVGQRAEYRFVLASGDVRFVESQGNVIKDSSGKVSKVVLVSRDITERRQTEKALHESEQRSKRLLASITDYIYTVTVENGRSVKTTHGAGSVALTGYTPAEYGADSQLWFRIVHKDDRESVLAHVKKILRGITPAPLEHRLIHKNGSIRWIRNTSVPRKDDQGRVAAYDGLISDITERKQAEERLKQSYAETARSEQALGKTLADLTASHATLKATQLELIQAAKMETIGTLTAGVAHEVKNPLQVMLLGLNYLEHHVPAENANVTKTLHDMRDAVTRANSIVGELLEFSAAGQLDMKEDDFNAVVERSLSLMNYELTTSQIAVARHLDAALPLVKMAPGKMEQVFLNLFMNAIQAMSAGGTLTVRTRPAQFSDELVENRRADCPFKAGEHIVIAEVQDTGVGIPEANLSKIFDPFFTTKPAGIGTGLGLSVIRKIIELHGGSIDIRNTAPGGVNVTLMLKNGVTKKVG